MVTPLRVGSCDAIAGRSMPGSVFSTKRAIAISAPVLPAETQACAAPSLTRLIATRIDESFFLRSASAGGSSIATTSLAGCIVSAIARRRARLGERLRERGLEADQDHARVGVLLEERERRRDRDRRAVVAAHRVDGNGDGHRSARSADRAADGDGARGRSRAQRTACSRASRSGGRAAAALLVGLGLDDLLAAVVAARADVMAQMRFAVDRLDGERRAR